MTFQEFKSNVEQWAEERGIYEHSTPDAQLLKTLSELGELADAVIKNDREALKDAIGDVAIRIVSYAKMSGDVLAVPSFDPVEVVSTQKLIANIAISIGWQLDTNLRLTEALYNLNLLAEICQRESFDFMECCESAWNEIKDRKGRMVAGGRLLKMMTSLICATK